MFIVFQNARGHVIERPLYILNILGDCQDLDNYCNNDSHKDKNSYNSDNSHKSRKQKRRSLKREQKALVLNKPHYV